MSEPMMSFTARSEEGQEIEIRVPTDAVEALQNLQPGEDPYVKMTGFTEAQLQSAFSRVQNQSNWKREIEAFCSTDDAKLVARAIMHFTSSEAKFDFIGIAKLDFPQYNIKKGDLYLKVRADGYYRCVGA